MPFLGEAAGLGTAVCFALTALTFTAAGRRVGSHAVNAVRIVYALVFLAALMLILDRGPWPWDMAGEPVLWLAISGVIGLAIGDGMLFRAYVLIGARLGSLLMALWPAVAALLSFLMLGETLTLQALAGIALTLASVAWVVSERQRARAANASSEASGRPEISSRDFVVGVALAMGGVFGQAIGFVLAKPAMLGAVERGLPAIDPLPATFARMAFGALAVLGLSLLRRRGGEVLKSFRDRRASLTILVGSVFGPFLGVWLSLIASLNTKIGVAGTLIATSPIWVIPLVIIVDKERVSPRAWLGAVGAILGVALLVLRPQ